jgi:hypothetical protein
VFVSHKHRENSGFSAFHLYCAMNDYYGSISIASRRMTVSILNLCNTNTKHFRTGLQKFYPGTCNSIQLLSPTRKAILLIPLRLPRPHDKDQPFVKGRIHTTLEQVLIKPEININNTQRVCAFNKRNA